MLRTLFVVLLVACVLAPCAAFAHKVNVFAYTEGQDVQVEASFPNGKPCKNTQVQATDAATGAELFSGRTDGKGKLRFTLPAEAQNAAKGLNIILNAGEGHRAVWLLEPEEYISGAASPSPASQKSEQPSTKPAQASQTPDKPHGAAQLSDAQVQELKKHLEHTLDTKLAPIKKMLIQSTQQGPSFRDILGGLGLIFGVVGLIAYIKSKKS